MRKSIHVIFLICLLSSTANTLHAQWIPMHGPYASDITAFAVSNTNIFAATTQSGIFRSSDNGKSWIACGTPNYLVWTLTASDSVVYAGTIGEGVWRSSDNAATWTAVNTGFPVNTSAYNIAIFGKKIFAVTNYGVYESSDNGSTWTLAYSELSTNFDVVTVSASNLYAGSSKGIVLSTDSGRTWTKRQNAGWPNLHITQLMTAGDHLLAGTTNGAYISADSGASWIYAGLADQSVESIVALGDDIFAGTVGNAMNDGSVQAMGGVFHSTDRGLTWIPVINGLTNNNVTALAISGSSIFAGTTYNSIYRSTDQGGMWTCVNQDMLGKPLTVLSLAASDSCLFAGTDRGGVFLSRDNGLNWEHIGLKGAEVPSMVCMGSYLIVAAGSVYRTSDNGRHWTKFGPAGTTAFRTLILSGTTLYAATYFKGIMCSTDSAKTWTPISTNLTSKQVLALAVADSHIVAGTYISFFHSADNGAHWTPFNKGLDTTNYLSYPALYAISDTDLISAANGTMYRLHGYDAAWSKVNTSVDPLWVNAFTASGTTLFAVTGNLYSNDTGTIVYSTDKGISWTSANTGLKKLPVYAFMKHGTDYFCGVYNSGVWRRPASEIITSAQEFTAKIPKDIGIEQNYPNPFNPSTTIRYAVPVRGRVSLKVFDMLGKEVATLVDDDQAAGTYSVRFDGARLPSGVYFARLTSSGMSQMRKLVLLK